MIPIAVWIAGAFIASLVTLSCEKEEGGDHPLKPDKPLPFPEEEEVVDAGSVSGAMDGGEEPASCIPDSCEGVIDPRLPLDSRGEEALCFSFAPVSPRVGLTGLSGYWRLRVIDFDRDGRPDLHLLRNNARDQLFQNGEEGFTDVAPIVGIDLLVNSRDAIWKDEEGDGDMDLFIASEEGGYLLLQNEEGRFVASDSIVIAEPTTAAVWLGRNILLGTENGLRLLRPHEQNTFPAARDRAWSSGFVDSGEAAALVAADYDGDGDDDVYVANNPGPDRLYRNLGGDLFESVEESLGIGSLGNSTDAQWIKISGEPLPSLYVSSWDGSNFLYINNQDGTFTEKSAEYGLRDPGHTTISAWGDIEQNIDETDAADLRPAVYLGRDGGPNLLYLPVLDENRHVLHYIETAAPLGMAMEATTVGAAWFDYNRDGLLDLAVATYEGGLYLFENRTHSVLTCPEEAIP